MALDRDKVPGRRARVRQTISAAIARVQDQVAEVARLGRREARARAPVPGASADADFTFPDFVVSRFFFYP